MKGKEDEVGAFCKTIFLTYMSGENVPSPDHSGIAQLGAAQPCSGNAALGDDIWCPATKKIIFIFFEIQPPKDNIACPSSGQDAVGHFGWSEVPS